MVSPLRMSSESMYVARLPPACRAKVLRQRAYRKPESPILISAPFVPSAPSNRSPESGETQQALVSSEPISKALGLEAFTHHPDSDKSDAAPRPEEEGRSTCPGSREELPAPVLGVASEAPSSEPDKPQSRQSPCPGTTEAEPGCGELMWEPARPMAVRSPCPAIQPGTTEGPEFPVATEVPNGALATESLRPVREAEPSCGDLKPSEAAPSESTTELLEPPHFSGQTTEEHQESLATGSMPGPAQALVAEEGKEETLAQLEVSRVKDAPLILSEAATKSPPSCELASESESESVDSEHSSPSEGRERSASHPVPQPMALRLAPKRAGTFPQAAQTGPAAGLLRENRIRLNNLAEHRVFSAGIQRLHKELVEGADLDLASMPRRKNGTSMVLQASFFQRLLSGKLELRGCLGSEVSGAFRDLRHLLLEQLLHLRLPELDFATASETHGAHSQFLDTVDDLIAEKLVERLWPSQEPLKGPQPTSLRGLGRQCILAAGAGELVGQGWGVLEDSTGNSSSDSSVSPHLWSLQLHGQGWGGRRVLLLNTSELKVVLPQDGDLPGPSWAEAANKSSVALVGDCTSGTGKNRRFDWAMSMLDPERDDMAAILTPPRVSPDTKPSNGPGRGAL